MKKIIIMTLIILLLASGFWVKRVEGALTGVTFTAVNPGGQNAQGDDTAGNTGAHWQVTIDFDDNGNLLKNGDKITITFPSGFDFSSSTINLTSFGSVTVSTSSHSGNTIIIDVTSDQNSGETGSVTADITNAKNPTLAGNMTGTVKVDYNSVSASETRSGSILIIPDLISNITINPHPWYMSIGETKTFIAESFDQFGNKRTGVFSIYGWEDKFNWEIELDTPPTGSAIFTTSSSNVDEVTVQATDWGHFKLKAFYPPGGPPYTIWGASDVYVRSYVTPARVYVNPPYAGSPAEYEIRFSLGPGGGLVGGVDWIEITFPYNTYVPSGIWYYDVLINGYPAITHYVYGRTVRITVPYTFSGGAYIVVTFPLEAGIINPTRSGTYRLRVSTSKEPTVVSSYPYVIYSSVISRPKVEVIPNVVTAIAEYTITFKTGPSGSLREHFDIISVKFPSDTYVPDLISEEDVKINGFDAYEVSTSGRKVTIKVPVNIEPKEEVEIVFTKQCGIKNPTEPGNYYLSVATSKEPTYVTSYYYKIVESMIKNLLVSVNPSVTKVEAEYRISFTTGEHGALEEGDRIYIKFPPYTKLPDSIDKHLITINGEILDKSPGINKTERLITIKTPTSFGDEEEIVIIISREAGIKNPGIPGSYKLKVWTEKEPTEVLSNSYTLTESKITPVSVKVTPPTVGRNLSFEIKFKTGPGGSMREGEYIYIRFSKEIDLPPYIPKEYVKVKGITLTSNVSISNNLLTIKTPIPVAREEEVTVVILNDAGIKIGEEGEYSLWVYTSRETEEVLMPSFLVYPPPATEISVSPEAPDGMNGWYKTTPIIELKAKSKYDKNPDIFYRWDKEAWNKYTGVITPPEGVHVLYYFARDHLGSEELPKSLVFKLDTTPPVIMNLNIREGMYVNTENIDITGNISEPLSVLLIQGKRIPIGSSGFFKANVSLNEGTNTISFIVIDVAGNRTFRGVKIIRDTIPPDIEIEYPAPWITVHTKIIKVRGKTEPGVELKVNGKSITVREDGRFTGEVKLERSETNALEFVVKDKAGNITRETVAVILILKVRIELFIGKREAFVNDMRKVLDYPPFIYKGRTMVPLRFISEGFGADVEWDPVVRVATITFSNEEKVVIKVSPGSNVASLNGKAYIMDVEPVIKEGRIFVPIRFVAEAFGSDVKWFLEERKVVIIYPRGG